MIDGDLEPVGEDRLRRAAARTRHDLSRDVAPGDDGEVGHQRPPAARRARTSACAVSAAIAWLRARRDSRPLCLFVGTNWPHVPWPATGEGYEADAVKVPILANLTEFGSTPFFTTQELASADVDIALYCCGAYRAMNAAALNFYQTVMRDGTQKAAVETMQSRDDLYKYLGYHAYEDKLDALFAAQK